MQTKLALILFGIAAVVLPLPATAWAQGSGSSRSTAPRATRPPTPEEFAQSFWRFLRGQKPPYTQWPALPGREGLREAQPPHGDFVKVYANKAATDSPDALPFGSILVAENYAKDKKSLKDIDVMYRVKATDPQHHDWYWLKYLPDGSVAKTAAKEGKKPIAGKVASCIECHSKAGGEDLVFSNDPAESK